MPFLEINNYRLNYNDSGTGAPVIFLHNGFYSTATWDNIRGVFSSQFRMIDYDRYGYGSSEQREGISGDIVEAGVQELEALVNKLDLKKVSLVGHCLGGAIAALFTGRNPSLVSKLILESVGYHIDSHTRVKTDWTFVPFDSMDPELRKSIIKMHGKDYTVKFWEMLRSHHDSYIMNKDYDIRSEVKKIKCPVLIINGDRDFYFAVEHAAGMYKKLKNNGELWIVPGTGHDVHTECKDGFLYNVIRFLEK